MASTKKGKAGAAPVGPGSVSASLAGLVDGAAVIVCCGTGGVGKTTTSAALAIEAARRGRRAVVVTIDPARRLADALGVPGGLGNDPVRLPLDGAEGELWAVMLDTEATFDGLVSQYASTPAQAERILANSFYRSIAGQLSGTQEYMAAERLLSLHGDPRFDLVVVDTPPSRHALDFLDAPGTLARFLDHPIFRLLMLPARRGKKVFDLATQPVLSAIGKVVGSEVLADAVAFFQAFAGMETGFRDRAQEVTRLLREDGTAFLLVASPRSDTLAEAGFFADKLHASGLPVAAMVVNRSTPDFGAPTGDRPASAGDRALYDNLASLHHDLELERGLVQTAAGQLGLDPAAVSWVAMLPADVHDMVALDQIRSALFAGR
jgi:anion-transporting  ArsA/GET3 family ATPase